MTKSTKQTKQQIEERIVAISKRLNKTIEEYWGNVKFTDSHICEYYPDIEKYNYALIKELEEVAETLQERTKELTRDVDSISSVIPKLEKSLDELDDCLADQKDANNNAYNVLFWGLDGFSAGIPDHLRAMRRCRKRLWRLI